MWTWVFSKNVCYVFFFLIFFAAWGLWGSDCEILANHLCRIGADDLCFVHNDGCLAECPPTYEEVGCRVIIYLFIFCQGYDSINNKYNGKCI
jgi:hypothetical protein